MESVDLLDVRAQGLLVRDIARSRRWKLRREGATGEWFVECYGRNRGEWTVEARYGRLWWSYYLNHGKSVSRLLKRARGVAPGIVDLCSPTEVYFLATEADAEALWGSEIPRFTPRKRRKVEMTPEERSALAARLARARGSRG